MYNNIANYLNAIEKLFHVEHFRLFHVEHSG